MPESAVISLRSERLLEWTDLQQLYDEHGPAVRALAERLLGSDENADDLVHDVFVIACQKCGVLRRKVARSFLFGTAVKLAARQRRRERVRRFFGLRSASDAAADCRTPERDAELREAQRVAYAILDRMPAKHRTVFILHELQGLTGEEIAKVLRCRPNTAWTWLTRGRREFMEGLAKLRRQTAREDPEGSP